LNNKIQLTGKKFKLVLYWSYALYREKRLQAICKQMAVSMALTLTKYKASFCYLQTFRWLFTLQLNADLKFTVLSDTAAKNMRCMLKHFYVQVGFCLLEQTFLLSGKVKWDYWWNR